MITRAELTARINARVCAAGAAVIDESLAEGLWAYFDTLAKWNTTTNLTSLSLEDPAPADVDRLFVEPLLVARFLRQRGSRVLDIGSGGGSPAIPLALALDASRLYMVEVRSRKAVFLREAARATGIPAVVHAQRVEDLAMRAEHRSFVELVSVRAVKLTVNVLTAARHFLVPGGRLVSFQSSTVLEAPGWRQVDSVSVPSGIVLIATPDDVPRGTISSAQAQPYIRSR